MAEGLITDCGLLLSRFENLQSVRFERFCEVWREMNFSMVHCGGRDSNGKVQIVDYLFRILSTYLDSTPCSFQFRIGALYALYAVYHTQLCQPKVKIRVTLSMTKDLRELHQQIIEHQHHDADYILRCLKNEKAFLFVATPIPLAYGSREAITNNEGAQSSVVIDDISDNVEERYRALENLGETHKNYKELKDMLQLKGTIPSDRSVSAISEDLVPDVTSALDKFDEWRRARCQKHILERKTGTSLPDQSSVLSGDQPSTSGEAVCSTRPAAEEDDPSKRINDIKKRSFSTVSKVSRSMRHLQPSMESSETPGKKKRNKR